MTKVKECTTTQWSWIPSGVKGTKISILMVQSPVLWYISWFSKKFYFSSPIFLLLQSSRDVLFENIWYIAFFILDQTFSFVCSDRSTGNWKAHWKMWQWEHIKWWFPGLIKTLRSIWVINSSEQNLRVAEKFLKKVFHFLRDSATKSLDLPVDKAITGLVSTFYKSISYKMWQNLQSHCSIKYLIRKKPIRTALRFPLCLGHVEAKYEK